MTYLTNLPVYKHQMTTESDSCLAFKQHVANSLEVLSFQPKKKNKRSVRHSAASNIDYFNVCYEFSPL